MASANKNLPCPCSDIRVIDQSTRLMSSPVLRNAAIRAVRVDHEDCLKLLLSCDNRTKNLLDELYDVSVKNGSHCCFKLILKEVQDAKKKINSTIPDSNGKTAIMVASENGHHRVVDVLLEMGASLDGTDTNNNTVWMHAAASGNVKCLESLLSELENQFNTSATLETKINHANNDGKTALMFAAEKGHTECIKALLKGFHPSKASLQKPDNMGRTALSYARSHDNCHQILLYYLEEDLPSSKDGSRPSSVNRSGSGKRYNEEAGHNMQSPPKRFASSPTTAGTPPRASPSGASPIAPTPSQDHPSRRQQLQELTLTAHHDVQGGGTPTALAGRSRRHTPYVKEIESNNLRLERLLGSEAYPQIWEATWKANSKGNVKTAVKLFQTPDQGNTGTSGLSSGSLPLEPFRAEAELLAQAVPPSRSTISSATVVECHGICIKPPCIVMEFCDNGTLRNMLKKAKEDPSLASQLTWKRRLDVAADAAWGMNRLHRLQQPAIHRNLTSKSILLDFAWNPRISNLGLSDVVVPEMNGRDLGAKLNPRWMAPESMDLERQWLPASDVYSFGVVLWELLTWELPWSDYDDAQVISAVSRGQKLSIQEGAELPGPKISSTGILEKYTRLMRKCLEYAPVDRPTFQEVAMELSNWAHKEEAMSKQRI